MHQPEGFNKPTHRQNKHRLPKPWKFSIALILTIGIFFRFANLDRKVFWFDEHATLVKISGYTSTARRNQFPKDRAIDSESLSKYYLPNPNSNVFDTIKLLSQNDPKHTPLYFGILRVWVDLFGTSVSAFRSLSAFISLLVFPCLYWLCLELFEKPIVGWISIALIAISPFHILYAQEARMYSLQMVTILLSSACLLRATRINTNLSWGLYALSSSLSVYTHTLFLGVAIAHGVYIVATESIRRNKILISYLIATLLSFISFLPWLLLIVKSSEQVAKSMDWANQSISLSSFLKHWAINLSRVFLDVIPSYRLNDFSDYNNYGSIFSISILLMLVGYSIYFLCRNTSKIIWLFVLILIVMPALILVLPDLLFDGIRSLNGRYLIASYLGIHLAVAYLFYSKVFQDRNRKFYQIKIWQGAMLALIASGIMSCTIISPEKTWWNKYYSSESLPISTILNRANNPILLIDGSSWSPGHLYSINHLLNPTVNIQILSLDKAKESHNIFESFNDVFFFRPSTQLEKELKNKQKHKINLVYQGEKFILLKLEK